MLCLVLWPRRWLQGEGDGVAIALMSQVMVEVPGQWLSPTLVVVMVLVVVLAIINDQ
jgi:hypothetical protein